MSNTRLDCISLPWLILCFVFPRAIRLVLPLHIAAWESAGGIGFKHKDHKFERTAKKLKADIEESFQHLLRENIEENFADGKVKGKSRPGRVKRSGASCKGSVTSLRKKAKNASGEKAKMYHWCANMKSGRK